MKTITLGAAVLLLSLAPAYADSNVLCVQQELASRGFDPGPLDGVLGVHTQAAAEAAGVAPLTYANAGARCASLRPTPRTYSYVTPVPMFPNEPPFVRRLDMSPRATFNSNTATLCPRYVIDTDDPCF